MLVLKEIKVSLNGGDIYIFSVKIDRSLIRPCSTFYKRQDHYGRDQVFFYLPLEGRIVCKGDLITIKFSQDHKTTILWSSSPQLQFDSLADTPISILTFPDDMCPLPYYYHILSARKGTEIKVRDEDEEVTIVF